MACAAPLSDPETLADFSAPDPHDSITTPASTTPACDTLRDQPLKGLKIVVDAGNGSGGFFAEKVQGCGDSCGVASIARGSASHSLVEITAPVRGRCRWQLYVPNQLLPRPHSKFERRISCPDPQVLAPLGADVSGSQFLEPDGTFPNHIPNPEAKAAMDAGVEAVKRAGESLECVRFTGFHTRSIKHLVIS